MPDYPSIHSLSVGAPYLDGGRRLPPSVQYNYRRRQHELLLVLDRPTDEEVESVRRGEARFALLESGPVIMLCYRFDPGLPWSDAPFSIHLVPEAERLPPEPADFAEPRPLLQIILIDDAGFVRVLRVLTLLPAFGAALHLAIKRQYEAPWPGRAAYDEAIDHIYRLYPTSSRLAAGARHRMRSSPEAPA